MLVLNSLKTSLRPVSFLILIIIFSTSSFLPSFLISMQFLGEYGEEVGALDLYLNYLKNKSFWGEISEIYEFINLSNLGILHFFNSPFALLILISFLSYFFLYHLFLPTLYKNLKEKMINFSINNSIFVLVVGLIQLWIYYLLLSFYAYINQNLKNYTETFVFESYGIALSILINFLFLIIFLYFRYFFSFLKLNLSFSNFSFEMVKESFSLSSKNYLKLSLLHLLLFLINYFLLQILGGNLLNFILKAYFILFSLSFYLSIKGTQKAKLTFSK